MKEEVRARLAIEDVIGEYVELKRAGRNFKGLSPFSQEKTPSFFVSPDKHIWHDFSSGKGGDVFSFVMEMEGMEFRAALEHLARKAGVDLAMYQSAGGKKIAERKKRLREAHRLATQYYQQSLLKNQAALEYVFKTRRLDKATVQDFQIGYAPDSGDALVRFLKKRRFSDQELRDSGLVNRFGGDLFRGRMMVPLMDPSGEVIGFTGRLLGDIPNAPKYLNTPATLLYDKSRHVFGLSQAKAAIRTNDKVVLVEGNLDVVSTHQANSKNVVATAGTALTAQHLQALARLTHDVRLAFDADKAGVAATERAIELAADTPIELTIITLPDGAKDPDELVKQSPEAWLAAVEAAQPAVDWVIDQYQKREDITTALGKRRFTSAALSVVAKLSDPVVRDHYEQKIASLTGSSIEAIRHKTASSHTQTSDRPRRAGKRPAPQAAHVEPVYLYEDAVLALGVSDPATRDLFRSIGEEVFHGEERRAVLKFLHDHADAKFDETPAELLSYDTYVKILVLKAETRYADWDAEHRYYEAAELLRRVTTEHHKDQKESLQRHLRDAEARHDDEAVQALLEQINTLDKEMRRAKR